MTFAHIADRALRALAETLEVKFADDVIEYFRQARQYAKGSHVA